MSPAYSPTLWEGMARHSDPDTAKAAAVAVLPDLNELQALVYGHIEAAGTHGATAWEIHEAMPGGPDQNSIAKRCSELHEDHLIRASGTRPGRSARRITVWIVG